MSEPWWLDDCVEADDQRAIDAALRTIDECWAAAERAPAGWGWQQYMYSQQLQQANKRIHELEQECAKLRADLKALMHAAAHPPVIEEEPVGMPANALRWGV
jgi:hypothetical protein